MPWSARFSDWLSSFSCHPSNSRTRSGVRPCATACHHQMVNAVGGWTSTRPAESRVSILLYDALDFSTDRDDGGGQTRESLPRIASPSAAVARLDVAFVLRHGVPRKFARIGSI